jgi:hypothetical protein
MKAKEAELVASVEKASPPVDYIVPLIVQTEHHF